MLAPDGADPALQIVAIACLLIIVSIVAYRLAQYQRRRRRRRRTKVWLHY